jgi:putative membrane protein
MNKAVRFSTHPGSLAVIGMKIFALLIFTVGCIWILLPETRAAAIYLTPWIILGSLLAILFFAASRYTLKVVFILAVILFAGFFIEVAGVKTGVIFGRYVYGRTLGITLLNTPLLIGVNWLFLVYASASVYEAFKIPVPVKVFLGSLIMLTYDIILEPVAEKMDMWHWQDAVIPFRNYITWFVMALLFHSLIKWSRISTRNSLAPWMLLCQFLFFITLRLLLK